MHYELTAQQQDIIRSSGNITVNAVAGSGKTSTLIAYAGSRPPGTRMLYLAFNRAVREEARTRFAQAGLSNVEAETAHSLAFRHVIRNSGYRIHKQGYRPQDLVRLLHLPTAEARHGDLILATHLKQYFSLFCNSSAPTPEAIDYASTLRSSDARNFVLPVLNTLQWYVSLLYSRMDKAEIEVSHDFYLKKFQQQCTKLPYDYILFDEGQDASEAMLDVFMRQRAVKVIVGDAHQQIYGWRYAVNSLARTGYPLLPLTRSFRFNASVAALAVEVLRYKTLLPLALRRGVAAPVIPEIEGHGLKVQIQSRATLARTNLGLLLAAIDFIHATPGRPPLFFEGHLNSYTYATDGASLYDVLSLYNGRRHLVRDPLLGQLTGFRELLDYTKATGDAELTMMVKIVEEYGNRIPGLLRRLRELHVEPDKRQSAAMIFSTVHRAKGMEYDEVTLVKDFITASAIRKMESDKTETDRRTDPDEEINLLYVAITRASVRLRIPEVLLPEGFVPGEGIEVIHERENEMWPPDFADQGELEDLERENRLWEEEMRARTLPNESAYPGQRYAGIKKVRTASANPEKTQPAAGYKPWTFESDQELIRLYRRGHRESVLAEHFKRSRGAILARIRKLDLNRIYGHADSD